MPNFKPKNDKKIKFNKKSIQTLDKKHDEKVKDIKDKENRIPQIEKEINQLETILKTIFDIQEKKKIERKKSQLEKKLKTFKKMHKSYYLKNAKHIFNYFENKKEITKDNNKKKVLYHFFNIPQENGDEEEQKEDCVQTSMKQYFKNNDSSYLQLEDYIVDNETCENCQGEMTKLEHEGIMICNKCFIYKPFLIDNDKPSYKEQPKEICFYAYKRINHFREILAQFQAKETTNVDDEIFEKIMLQIKKERITKEQLTNEKTKQILKNLGYNKYYEHIPYIKEKLGLKPPRMSIELENKLCNLFMEIQKPYSKYCPNQRVNFLNYYYVLYKLCELLREDEYLPHFYMLKDQVKRMEQDEIWKNICKELEWEFIPTL